MLLFQPPEDAQPPEAVRIIKLSVQPWEDNKRVKVFIELTSFQSPPNLEITITDPAGNILASTNIIESILTKIVFTMHIREFTSTNHYLLNVAVGYQDLGTVSHASHEFSLNV